jgi:hypothetical protein
MNESREPDLLVLFLMALMGIIGTGGLVAIGGSRYWLLVTLIFGAPYVSPRTTVLFGLTFFAVGVFDLIAFGMVFAGGVMVVQRFRGRI